MAHCGTSVVPYDHMMTNWELPSVVIKDLTTYYQAMEKTKYET